MRGEHGGGLTFSDSLRSLSDAEVEVIEKEHCKKRKLNPGKRSSLGLESKGFHWPYFMALLTVSKEVALLEKQGVPPFCKACCTGSMELCLEIWLV